MLSCIGLCAGSEDDPLDLRGGRSLPEIGQHIVDLRIRPRGSAPRHCRRGGWRTQPLRLRERAAASAQAR